MKSLLPTLMTCALVLAGMLGLSMIAYAHGADAARAPDHPMLALAAMEPAAAPAPIVAPDPVDNPSGFWDALVAAKKLGWPVAIMVGVAAIAATLLKRVAWLHVEGTRRAAALTGVSGIATAALAALDGGSWSPVIVAVGVAAALIYDPKSKPKGDPATKEATPA